MRLVKRCGVLALLSAGVAALGLASSPEIRAQTRITLASLQAQINGILSGAEPVGRAAFVSGFNLVDDRDSGKINGRGLIFTKSRADTILKITYCDAIRVLSTSYSGVGNAWSILLDGQAISQHAVWTRGQTSNYYGVLIDNVSPTTITAFVPSGLAAGSHVLEVSVGPISGLPPGDALTGFRSNFYLAVEEIPSGS